jgi:hypothetical protein
MSFIFIKIRRSHDKKTLVTLFQTFSEKPEKNRYKRGISYWTRVNLRLNPIFVFEVGKVLATKGSLDV